MKAAVVWTLGNAPLYSAFENPVPHGDDVLVHVTASALTNFTKLRAMGKHSSFVGRPPFVVGIDGVGRLADGERIYFLFPQAPFGGMAERTVAPLSRCIRLPDSVDDVTAAAIADPGMAALAALTVRANVKAGESILINGATGSAGRVAVQLAKRLGAGRVVATGRNEAVLQSLLTMGADEIVLLGDDMGDLQARLRTNFANRIDVVLDYLWGPSAEQILAASTSSPFDVTVRYVQIGNASAPNITLPGPLLRSSSLQLMGSGVGNVPLETIVRILVQLMQSASQMPFQMEIKAVPLSSIEQVWSSSDTTQRLVMTMNA